MEKPIIMRFHRKKDHDDFVQMIREEANLKGETSIKVRETEEAIVVETLELT